MLITALALHVQQIPIRNDLFGRYLRTNATTKPTCDAPGEKYLVIGPKRAVAQAQIDLPNVYDIGVVGYARCPS